ncbi:inactive pancreatic lipase-related protein 1-like [Ostrea edulis]|uniref:inactive pancreatic lipase-related protein 1-like n=1 Tax=Ostrea edulis TaxID=37623 RepID=UPI0024AEFC9E|nr:inactive pancreatic lipase-related protein 1-like [Ostrea edulis]
MRSVSFQVLFKLSFWCLAVVPYPSKMLKSLTLLCLLSSTQGWWFFSSSTQSVCYKNVGCFSNQAPFDNANGYLPQSPDKIQITFMLYTRQNNETAQNLKPYNSSTITNSNFAANRPTIFITHGFTDTTKSGWAQEMKDAFLQKGDMNVITVDWSNGADFFNYDTPTANTRVVGATVGNMVKALKDTVNLPLSQVHLIGHSLGAQVMGYAGDWNRGDIGRITGLDPAGVHFETYDTKVKLDPFDANFVDVIHTNAASLWEMAAGIKTPNGHTDFYPNGGKQQPGCSGYFWTNLKHLLFGEIEPITDNLSCSHIRAIDFFIESINSQCEFLAFPCKTYLDFVRGKCTSCEKGCNKMGYHANNKSTGKFYLNTGADRPFCRRDMD